jgi:hypothetical protein
MSERTQNPACFVSNGHKIVHGRFLIVIGFIAARAARTMSSLMSIPWIGWKPAGTRKYRQSPEHSVCKGRTIARSTLASHDRSQMCAHLETRYEPYRLHHLVQWTGRGPHATY